jgi:hypothetical protein
MKKFVYTILGLVVGFVSIIYLTTILFPTSIASRMDDIQQTAKSMIKSGYMGKSCNPVLNQGIYLALPDKSKFDPYKNDDDHFWNLLYKHYPECIKKATLIKLSSENRPSQGSEITVYGIYRGEYKDYTCELQIAFFLNSNRSEDFECNYAIFYKEMDIPLGRATEPSYM